MSAKPAKRRSPRPAPEPLTAEAPLNETTARLAGAAVPVEPPSPRVKAELLARIRASAPVPVQPGWRYESAREESGWRGGVFPGVRFKTLSVDEARDVVAVMIEIAPGARFPDHLHDAGPDEGVVISGDVVNGGRLMHAGDYYYAAEGTAHVNTVSPHGCTALVTLTARAWKKWREAMAAR